MTRINSEGHQFRLYSALSYMNDVLLIHSYLRYKIKLLW